jgi:hypothetical protein
MTRTIVALAVLSLVIGFVMWQRRRRAPVKQPEVTIITAPEPVVEPMDMETYELVEAGIPEELIRSFIDQHAAAKERGWWDRSKYDLATAATLGALGWAGWRWLDEAEKRHGSSEFERTLAKMHQMRKEQEMHDMFKDQQEIRRHSLDRHLPRERGTWS